MVSEGELELVRVAGGAGSPLERVDEAGSRRPVTLESFVGVGVIDAICAFARERTA